MPLLKCGNQEFPAGNLFPAFFQGALTPLENYLSHFRAPLGKYPFTTTDAQQPEQANKDAIKTCPVPLYTNSVMDSVLRLINTEK